MTDEEKKAIAEVKDVIEYDKEHRIVTIYDKQSLFRDTLQTLLNLIEKKQKAIEDLENGDLTTVYISGVYDGEKKVEDKIKAKIEEVNKIINEDKDFINKFQNTVDADVINWYYQKVDLNVRIRNILESLLEKE